MLFYFVDLIIFALNWNLASLLVSLGPKKLPLPPLQVALHTCTSTDRRGNQKVPRNKSKSPTFAFSCRNTELHLIKVLHHLHRDVEASSLKHSDFTVKEETSCVQQQNLTWKMEIFVASDGNVWSTHLRIDKVCFAPPGVTFLPNDRAKS